MSDFNNIIYKCLIELGCNFDLFLWSKTERVKAQKYSYLIEKIYGVGVGKFSLYLNGPYNSMLADELYDIARNRNKYVNEAQINPLSEDASNLLRQLNGNFSNQQIDEVDLLELYTTFDYLKHYYPSFDNDAIFAQLSDKKSTIYERYSNLGQNSINDIISNIDHRINELMN